MRQLTCLRHIVAFETCAENIIRTAENENYILNTLMKLELANWFPDLVTISCICLALPLYDATNGRSFSQIKLIKSYLRSTIVQDRLSDLGIRVLRKIAFLRLREILFWSALLRPKLEKRNFNYCLNTNCVCQL